MYKVLSFQSEARAKLLKGVKLLADAVTITLGPKGRNVAITRQWGMPIVVHDGVTVAREVESQDPLEAVGINLVREAAQKTNEEAGDGTTTATLLAYEIIRRGMDLIEKGTNPMVLRDEIYEALPVILAELKRLSVPSKGKEDIVRVATISSADEKIGKFVAEAMEKVGENGLVTVNEGGVETEIDYTEGMEFNRGYLSPYFITNPQRMEAVVTDPVIVLLAKKVSLNTEIVPILEEAAKVSKDIVIIAEDLKGDALATLAANKMKGNINALAVLAPSGGQDQLDYFEDIAVLVGGKVLSDSAAIDIKADSKWLGRAEKVVSDKESTVIISGGGDKKELAGRITALKEQKKTATEFVKEKLEERLAHLSKGVAVIRVGAKTEVDMRERIERVKDAVGAATAAREEGVVPGGGSVFIQMSLVLKDKTQGEKLLHEILEMPARKLIANSGENEDVINSIIGDIILTPGALGYEVQSGEFKDLVKAGIIDPAKVVRLALENAISVATSILTTECLIGIQIEESDKKGRE